MLQLYNTLSRQKEEFKPLHPPKVGFYSCGPTVYNYPHIGNYRAYIFSDILKRYLIYKGFEVKHVMNLTDVDDKTIRDSQKEKKGLKEFTEFYSQAFFEDLKKLNILPADVFPKATEHIPEMLALIEKLVKNNFAYQSEDKSIYYTIKKFENYGRLSKVDMAKTGRSRIAADEYTKEDVQDFALWKAYDEKDGDIFWETKWGRGRPGWHIECSAMSMKHLGESFDIHTGGVDLVFPHHENEIAQSEGATGEPFVKYWLHNEWLLVDGKKMSKSLGNFITLRDIENPIAYRYLILTAHYRTVLNFTWESLKASEIALNKLYEHFLELGGAGNINLDYKKKFTEAMDADLDTPKALATVWEFIKDSKISKGDKKATLLDFDKVLGFGLDKIKPLKIPEEVKKLVEEREGARQNKDFKKADKLRKEILELGYEIRDTEEGPRLAAA